MAEGQEARPDDLRTPLERLREAKHLKEYAGQKYEEAYELCVRSNISYRAIAKVLDHSDTAVRMYAKRKGWKQNR